MKRLSLFTMDDLDIVNYYKSNIKITYKDISNIWLHYIEKYYFSDNTFNINDEITKSCLKISLFENTLSLLLEHLLSHHNCSIYDDLLLFYIKDEENVLLLYKSYYPLSKNNKIQLPYRSFLLESYLLSKQINTFFEEDENICVMAYSLSNIIIESNGSI